MGKENFNGINGVTFDTVKQLFSSSGFIFQRSRENRRKFVLIKDEQTIAFRWTQPFDKLQNEISKGLDAFIKTNCKPYNYQVEVQEDGEDSNSDDHREKELKKIERKNKISHRQSRKIDKQKESEIEALTSKIHDLVVKIMNFNIPRGSEEHLILKKQLHELYHERKELGYSGGAIGGYTQEELIELKQRGEEYRKKKREHRKMKKEKRNPSSVNKPAPDVPEEE